MKFKVIRASNISGSMKPCEEAVHNPAKPDDPYDWEIEVNSLEDLLRLSEKYKCDLIVDADEPRFPPTLWFYDDYME